MTSSEDTECADQMKCAAHVAVWVITFFSYLFGSILYHSTYDCMFCMLLLNFVILCILIVMFMHSYCHVCSVLCILFHCVVVCIVCVSMCTVLLPPGVNPNAVNKYTVINSRQQVTTPNIGICCYTPAIAVYALKIKVLHSDMAYHGQRVLSNVPRYLDLLCRIHQLLFICTYIYRGHT